MNPRDGMEATEPPGPARGSAAGDDGGQEREAQGGDDKTPGAYACSLCGRSFPFLSSLSQHMRRHTGARPYKCPYCHHRASQKGNLKVHIRSHKLGTLSSHHAHEEAEPGGGEEDEEEEETSSAEVSVSEGLDGGTSPTKSSSACNRVLGGAGDSAEEGRRKIPARSVKREKPAAAAAAAAADQRPFCCRLCGYEAQREDQLLSHIEKVHITADQDPDPVQDPDPDPDPDQPAPAAAKEDAGSEGDAAAVLPSDDGTFPCETCGQVFTQAWFLKSHMKKHAGILEHCCRVCGRRFREAWFLKSHMKTHTAKSRSRPRAEHSDPPATINDVAQDPDGGGGAGVAVTSVYQICCKCGNLFHSRESLRAHEKVHAPGRGKRPPRGDQDRQEGPAAKRSLLDYLNLRAEEEEEMEEQEEQEEERSWLGKRIPELDPVCSYQAWQLATRGRVAEPAEPSLKSGSSRGGAAPGEDGLAAAAVVYEKESSRYVLQGQERCGAPRRGGRTSSGDLSAESHSDSEYRPAAPRQDRRRPTTSAHAHATSSASSSSSSSSSSKANECFECGKVFRGRHQLGAHLRVHRREGGAKASGAGGKDRVSASDPDSGSPGRPGTPGDGEARPGSRPAEAGAANAAPTADGKPYVCSLCDFTAAESQVYLTHVRLQHPNNNNINNNNNSDGERPSSTPPGAANNSSASSKLKTPLLAHAAPQPSLPARPARDQRPASEPLDLCVRPGGHRGPASSAAEGKGLLPRHKCSFCSHATGSPEVLWMHQTVAHRISSGSSTLAPRWALRPTSTSSTSSTSGPRTSSSSSASSCNGRRTGPPPALEGREFPPLPSDARNPRTRPPPSPTAARCSEAGRGGRSAGRPSAPPSPASSFSSSSSGRPSSASGRPPAPGRAPPPPARPVANGGGGARRSGEQELSGGPWRSRPKVDLYPRGAAGPQPSSSPSPTGSLERRGPPVAPAAPGGSRPPQEGLGFMLSSKHGLAPDYARGVRASAQPPRKAPSPLLHHHLHQQQQQQHTSAPTHHLHHLHPSQQQHASSAHSRAHANASRPSAISHGSLVGRGYESPAPLHLHGGALQNSMASGGGGQGAEKKQEAAAETPEGPADILGFLKNYSPHELAALYQRWGAANALLDPSGMLRSLMRQGGYACHECGKSFSQPSHLRTHMRSHTVGFDFNGLNRGADAHANAAHAEAPPKQVRERPFCCQLCPYRASQKGNLKTHMESVHHHHHHPVQPGSVTQAPLDPRPQPPPSTHQT